MNSIMEVSAGLITGLIVSFMSNVFNIFYYVNQSVVVKSEINTEEECQIISGTFFAINIKEMPEERRSLKLMIIRSTQSYFMTVMSHI